MAALGWLLNLGFAGGSVGVTLDIEFDIGMVELAKEVDLGDVEFPTSEDLGDVEF